MFSLKKWPHGDIEIVYHLLDFMAFDKSEYGTLRFLTDKSLPTHEQMFNARRRYLTERDIFDV